MTLEREVPRVSAGQREASRALERTIAAEPAVAGLRAEMSEHAAVLRQMRARNHFAESMDELFRGGVRDRDRDRRGRP